MKKILFAFLFLQTIVSWAQTENSYSSWNTINLRYAFNDSLYINNETHFRRIDFLENPQQFLLRPSVHYALNATVEFALGYTHIENYGVRDLTENNVWEQVTLTHTSGKVGFSHRFRFEQRFVEMITAQDTETNFLTRFRYRFTFKIPLFRIIEDKQLTAVLFDEIWLNTGSGLLPESLNQNWIFAGVSYPLFKNATLGVGYMHAYLPLGNERFIANHVLQTSLGISF